MSRLLPAAAGLLAALLAACAHRVVVPVDPLTADEHVQLGATYEAEGRADLAARSYEAALRRDGGHAAAHLGLGNLAAGRGDLAEAERRYRRALGADPRNPDAMNNLAWVHLQRGDRLEEAAALARRALDLAPARTAYYADTLGVALTRGGRPADGLAALRQALAAAPAGQAALRAEVLAHMAEAYRALGRGREAARADAEATRLSSAP